MYTCMCLPILTSVELTVVLSSTHCPGICRQGKVRRKEARDCVEDKALHGLTGADTGGQRGAHRHHQREEALEQAAHLPQLPGEQCSL